MEPVSVKVTRLKGIGYGIRVWLRGKLHAEKTVGTRLEVGPAIKEELRWIDKAFQSAGSFSRMASASRDRK